MSATSAPVSFRQPYTRRMEEMNSHDWSFNPTFHGLKLGTYYTATDIDWRAIELLLVGIDATNLRFETQPEKGYAEIARVARVEFRWTQEGHVEHRGAVLFDANGQPILHAMHALLGYGGSGSGLSRNILQVVGVSEAMFEEVNTSVKSRAYDTVVFSREATAFHEGVEHAARFTPVKDAWSWWIG